MQFEPSSLKGSPSLLDDCLRHQRGTSSSRIESLAFLPKVNSIKNILSENVWEPERSAGLRVVTHGLRSALVTLCAGQGSDLCLQVHKPHLQDSKAGSITEAPKVGSQPEPLTTGTMTSVSQSHSATAWVSRSTATPRIPLHQTLTSNSCTEATVTELRGVVMVD